MLHAFQHRIGILNNAATGGAADMRNETHPATIVLKGGVIEPLGAGWSFADQGFTPRINRPQISQGARTRLARLPTVTRMVLGGPIGQQPYRRQMPSCSTNTSATAEQVYRQPKTGSNRLTLWSGQIWLISTCICPSLVQSALLESKNKHYMGLSDYLRTIFLPKKRRDGLP
jgi:hypothetical protein